LKSFSWTLALRYLNPLRTFVSIITLISLLGVAFGVMVLIVVLSVHNGFERNLKEMLLGFSPHITVVRSDGGTIKNWQEMEETLAKKEDCVGAYAVIEGYALLDSKLWQRPVGFRAVHSGNEDQVKALTELLDPDYPGSRADMGMEPNAVVSKQLAVAMGLTIGDEIRLLAASNLEAVMAVYNVPKERATDLYPEVFADFEDVIRKELVSANGLESVGTETIIQAYRKLEALLPSEGVDGQPMRPFEKDEIIEILIKLEGTLEQKEGRDYYPEGTSEEILKIVANLREFDLKEADNTAFREIEEFVTPKTFKVWGVYSDTQRSQGPSIFIPLEIGMELKGLKGDAEAIGVLCEDPYKAGERSLALQNDLGDEWFVQGWMKTHSGQFQLVKTEKIMMSFALSFITVLSAFSIMAVMYTVTVQKRQEIGVMKALGAQPSQIVKVFVYQGIIVGVGGALLGLGLGLLAIENREHIVSLLRTIGIDPFPPDFHGMSEMPAHVVPEQLGIIAVVAVILCILAALVPALMAAFRDPAKSLRNL